LDPNKKYISGMMTRSNCMETKNGFFIKDLRLIQNKELKDMLFIDNLVHSFGFQIENGVPILEWFDDSNDCELKELMDYLIEATNYDDLREYNVKKLKLDELIDFHIE
jgi:CTD small phosphatase-like protein 2